MKSVLQIAAGILVGTGLVVMAGANLRVHDATPSAPAPAQPATVAPPAATPSAGAVADSDAWRAQARPPDAVSPGMLARVARRVADRAPACAPPPAKGARAAATPAAAAPLPCRAGEVIESVEIDWHGSSSTP